MPQHLAISFPTSKAIAIRSLEADLDKYIPANTFYRWLRCAGLTPAFQYTARDLAKLRFVGDYLQSDRNLERASAALATALVDNPDWFPEPDGCYFSEATTIDTEAKAS